MADSARFTTMRSLLQATARAMNQVNAEVAQHHEQTAFLALFITRELGMPESDSLLAVYASLLHDIGAAQFEETPTVVELERQARELSRIGVRMIGDLPGFAEIAAVISFCQCNWDKEVAPAIQAGAVSERLGRIASVVHLADAVSLLVKPEERVLNQSKRIMEIVKGLAGKEFCPQAVAALEKVAELEYVWLDVAHNPSFLTYFTGDIADVSLERALDLTGFMSRIIDYRSSFTAMHSAGVAASARELAVLAGMDERTVLKMQIAGNLHDVGKLKVPREILEKPGKLTDDEFGIMREHTYYTSLVLLNIEGFEDIRKWAAHHHEKLDGSGYPFHLSAAELGPCERFMAIADIFSAITEERPYRAGMTREKAAAVLRDEVHRGKICSDGVALLLDNYEQVDYARDQASRTAGKRYFKSLEQN